jgi:glycosyltransferase involved in cell wall biosynthesis
MPEFSVIILTYNEAGNIEACLDSLAPVQAPVFVVDSYSTDGTLEILRERQVAHTRHGFENYARQRNWAQENSPYETEWVLHLDAGERLSSEMADWLNREFDSDAAENGFLFSRRTVFMGRWIRHGGHYPAYHLRLFRKQHGYCEDKAYDQHFVCPGEVRKVAAGVDLIDQVSRNLAEFTASHNRWALAEARERLLDRGNSGQVRPRLTGNPIERRRWLKSRLFERLPLFLRAFLYFHYRYFLRLGFMDGRPGLVFHFLQGFWFRFLVDAMILEVHREVRENGGRPDQAIENLYGDQ